jgi:5-methylcytosine-specific restriction endonuclease McrA
MSAKRKPSGKPRAERTRNHGTMTDAMFRAMIIGAIRKKSLYWKPRQECLRRAECGTAKNPATGKTVKICICAICKGRHLKMDMQADHILPVVDPKVGWQGWDSYFSRMFVEVDGYQALCHPCHNRKTAEENGQRGLPTVDEILAIAQAAIQEKQSS